MILGLLVAIVSVAGFAAHEYSTEDTSLTDEATPRSHTSLQVEDGEGVHQGAQNIGGSVLQSSNTNIQSAGGADIYENYDSQSGNESGVQPQ